MSDQLRERLHDEMAGLHRPSLDGLVTGAVSQGSRIRGRRRLLSGAGSTALVGTVAAVVALGGQVVPGHPAPIRSAAGAAPAAVTAHRATVAKKATPATQQALAAPVASDSAAAPAPADVNTDRKAELAAVLARLEAAGLAGTSDPADKRQLVELEQGGPGPVAAPAALPPGVAATPAGMLELLTSLLPAGATSNAGVADDGSRMVETYVATPSGPAMLRVSLGRLTYVPVGCSGQTDCTVEPNGDIVTVGGIPDNCIQTRWVTVTHPDGSNVSVNLSTCREWDGTANVASPLAMTTAEATTLLSDPRWDVSMDPSLVSAGAAHFPSPHQFG